MIKEILIFVGLMLLFIVSELFIILKISPEEERKWIKKKEIEEKIIQEYNEGRLEADKKWIEAINERIAELEKSVGIPELRRLKEKTRYLWKWKYHRCWQLSFW